MSSPGISPVGRPASRAATSVRPISSFSQRTGALTVYTQRSVLPPVDPSPEPKVTRWETPLPSDQAALAGLVPPSRTDYIYGPSLPSPSPQIATLRTGLPVSPVSPSAYQSPVRGGAQTPQVPSDVAVTQDQQSNQAAQTPQPQSGFLSPSSTSGYPMTRLRLRSPMAGDFTA